MKGRNPAVVFDVDDTLLWTYDYLDKGTGFAGDAELRAGDLGFMGTPAGVAALQPGDHWEAGIDGFISLAGSIAAGAQAL